MHALCRSQVEYGQSPVRSDIVHGLNGSIGAALTVHPLAWGGSRCRYPWMGRRPHLDRAHRHVG